MDIDNNQENSVICNKPAVVPAGKLNSTTAVFPKTPIGQRRILGEKTPAFNDENASNEASTSRNPKRQLERTPLASPSTRNNNNNNNNKRSPVKLLSSTTATPRIRTHPSLRDITNSAKLTEESVIAEPFLQPSLKRRNTQRTPRKQSKLSLVFPDSILSIDGNNEQIKPIEELDIEYPTSSLLVDSIIDELSKESTVIPGLKFEDLDFTGFEPNIQNMFPKIPEEELKDGIETVQVEKPEVIVDEIIKTLVIADSIPVIEPVLEDACIDKSEAETSVLFTDLPTKL